VKPYEINGPCQEWTKSKTKAGYGNKLANGKVKYVHRLEWEKHNGPIPTGLCVLHKCDNPPCYNIEHLFLGTKAENMIDKTLKGRGKNPNRRLSTMDVEAIRARIRSGESNKSIAADFAVTGSNISHIKRGASWV